VGVEEEMRTLIAIAALVLLASCADSPSKPNTSGGSSSGSRKIVTATPKEIFVSWLAEWRGY
jgi:hypothetical protein